MFGCAAAMRNHASWKPRLDQKRIKTCSGAQRQCATTRLGNHASIRRGLRPGSARAAAPEHPDAWKPRLDQKRIRTRASFHSRFSCIYLGNHASISRGSKPPTSEGGSRASPAWDRGVDGVGVCRFVAAICASRCRSANLLYTASCDGFDGKRHARRAPGWRPTIREGIDQ